MGFANVRAGTRYPPEQTVTWHRAAPRACCRRHGVHVMVDGAHAVGSVALDMAQLERGPGDEPYANHDHGFEKPPLS